jgi:hypothetical protein
VEKPQNNWCLFESIPTKVWTIPGTSRYLLHTQCTYVYYYYVYTLLFRPKKRPEQKGSALIYLSGSRNGSVPSPLLWTRLRGLSTRVESTYVEQSESFARSGN